MLGDSGYEDSILRRIRSDQIPFVGFESLKHFIAIEIRLQFDLDWDSFAIRLGFGLRFDWNSIGNGIMIVILIAIGIAIGSAIGIGIQKFESLSGLGFEDSNPFRDSFFPSLVLPRQYFSPYELPCLRS